MFETRSQKDRPSSLAPRIYFPSPLRRTQTAHDRRSRSWTWPRSNSLRRRSGHENASTRAARKDAYANFHGSLGFYLATNREICPQNCLQLSWASAKLTGPANAAFCAQLLAKQIVNVSRGCPKISLTYLNLPTSTPAPNANKPQSKSSNTKPTTNKPNKQIKTHI